MNIEIIATLVIFSLAAFILYKNIKNKADGKCDCSSCDRHCHNNKEKTK